MARVLKECARVEKSFDADAVHDLRVALRRCRSMADGLREVDPHPAWRKMKKSSGKLFGALGDLRDTQVMREWVERLAPEGDPVRGRMLELLAEQEQQGRAAAERALKHFDRKDWRGWSRELPERARRVVRDTAVCRLLALERFEDAHELDRRARRNRSRTAYHRLRIGIKHFRYTVENFLPHRYAEWGPDLKQLQDLLGEAHDLDLLWAALRRTGEIFDAAARIRWRGWIETTRESRLAEYRGRVTGPASRWPVWRAELPEGRKLERAAMAKLCRWASFLDPDPAHAGRVAAMALEVFDDLDGAGSPALLHDSRARRILEGAARLHDVGRAEGDAGHHKASYRLIQDLTPPRGWTNEDMRWLALIARYHRGAEPRPNHEGYGALSPDEQRGVAWLAAILRFADSFDSEHNGRITRLEARSSAEAIFVAARGYTHDLLSAATIAQKKHLLEIVSGRPVIVRAEDMRRTPSALASKAS
jgi:CHAD domain-containing protein